MPKVVYIFVTNKFAEGNLQKFQISDYYINYSLFVLQIVEVDFQRAGGDDQFTDREAERRDQKQ